MSDSCCNKNGFKEAVCIEAQRIFDSCSDRDCLEDLKVTLTGCEAQSIINEASFVKCKCVEVTSTFFTLEPVPFNCGFYSVDLTYTFNLKFEAYSSAWTAPRNVEGTCTFSKKVILFGSCQNTKFFSSEDNGETQKNGCCYTNMPKAAVTIAEPICLDSKICCGRECYVCSDCCCEDECAEKTKQSKKEKCLIVTLGMFSIIQLSRKVPLLVPVYEYCVPEKSCPSTTESPCEMFEKISFPSSEFFPKSAGDCGCGCCSCEAECNEDCNGESV